MKLNALFVFVIVSLNSFSQTSGKEKLSAFKKQQQLIRGTPYKNVQWRLVGPDNRSGRATDVEGINGDTSIIYAAFATGGLWKTTDGGETWNSLFDREATLSIGDIYLAPSDHNVLYVGTGEANIFRASLTGAGLYKSMDAGITFQHIGL
ncbi:MAG TPA: hypothetical protein VEB42_16805, partial [Chitinophagaceae bacterium]|nr:hypothetical protein [Chitinophagaceae bacterium]